MENRNNELKEPLKYRTINGEVISLNSSSEVEKRFIRNMKTFYLYNIVRSYKTTYVVQNAEIGMLMGNKDVFYSKKMKPTLDRKGVGFFYYNKIKKGEKYGK